MVFYANKRTGSIYQLLEYSSTANHLEFRDVVTSEVINFHKFDVGIQLVKLNINHLNIISRLLS